MTQDAFERRFSPAWTRLESVLVALEERVPHADELSFPEQYRALCQHLSLARHRGYSAALVERLNQLALRGQVQLYARTSHRRRRISELLLVDFPRAVRRDLRLVIVATALFYGPGLFALGRAAQDPDEAYRVMSPADVASFEEMYDPAVRAQDPHRAADGDLAMFGFYVRNNVGIALRTFGMGILLGVGSGLTLVYNGLVIGTVAGRLHGIGFGSTFWPFVAGHSSFELTAIVIAGAAGMKVGFSLLRPGQRTRARALREEARDALPLVTGFSAMLLIAAVIEAFWSSSAWLPDTAKFAAAAVFWTVVLAWLGLGGRVRGS